MFWCRFLCWFYQSLVCHMQQYIVLYIHVVPLHPYDQFLIEIIIYPKPQSIQEIILSGNEKRLHNMHCDFMGVWWGVDKRLFKIHCSHETKSATVHFCWNHLFWCRQVIYCPCNSVICTKTTKHTEHIMSMIMTILTLSGVVIQFVYY